MFIHLQAYSDPDPVCWTAPEREDNIHNARMGTRVMSHVTCPACLEIMKRWSV